MYFNNIVGKVTLFIGILISLFSCSSQNDELNTETINGNGPLREMAFTITTDPSSPTLPTPKTAIRSTLGEDKHTVEWLKGDKVSLFANTIAPAQTFTALNSGTRSKITGKLSTTTPAFALYPANEQAKYGGKWMTTVFPTYQTAEADNIPQNANLAFCVPQNNTNKNVLSFQNVCALLNINFTLDPALSNKKIGKIVLFSAPDKNRFYNDNISGGFKVNLDNRNFNFQTLNDSLSRPFISLENQEGFTAGTNYYMCVPSRTFENGFELHFVTTDNQEVTIKRFKGKQVLNRNTIYPIRTTLKSMKSAILRNVPLINIANANAQEKFVQEEDGTVQLYRANNYKVLKSIINLTSDGKPYGLTSLDELPYYSNASSIFLSKETNLSGNADFSKNKHISLVLLSNSKITSADFHGINIDWKIVLDNNNSLEKVDLDHTKIKEMSIANIASFHHIDVSTIPMLEILTLTNIGIEKLNLQQNSNLTYLNINGTSLHEIDLTQQQKLTTFTARSAARLSKIDFGTTAALRMIDIANTRVPTIDISHHTELRQLDCHACNNLSTLQLQNNTLLSQLDCNNCKLSTLDLSHNTKLSTLNCCLNELNTLDISMLPLLMKGNDIIVGRQDSGNIQRTLTLTLTQNQKNNFNTELNDNRNITFNVVP